MNSVGCKQQKPCAAQASEAGPEAGNRYGQIFIRVALNIWPLKDVNLFIELQRPIVVLHVLPVLFGYRREVFFQLLKIVANRVGSAPTAAALL